MFNPSTSRITRQAAREREANPEIPEDLNGSEAFDEFDDGNGPREGTRRGRSSPLSSLPDRPSETPSTLPVIDHAVFQQQMMSFMSAMAANQQQQQQQDRERLVRESTTPSSTFKEPKAREPDTFNGRQPEKLNQFIMECDLVFKLQPSRYYTEEIKVTFMMSYLRGVALDAVRPLSTAIPPALELSSRDAFVRYLKDNFGDPDERGTARRHLKELKQTGTASEYFARMRELIAVLGWRDQEPIVDKAIDGLSSTMKDELARHGREFESFDELIRFIVPLDNRLRVRDLERKAEVARRGEVGKVAVAKSFLPAVPPASMVSPSSGGREVQGTRPQAENSTSSSVPVRRGTLPEAERERRRVENACYRCGQTGHFLPNCPLTRVVSRPLPPIPSQAPKQEAKE